MKLFYSRNAEGAPKGAKFRNARLYSGPDPKASTVYLDGDYPRIEADYAALDAVVIRLDVVLPAYVPADPSSEVVAIPADWRTLPWTQPDERGVTLRGIASQVSDGPIKTKDEAIQAIETYLAGDLDRPLAEANGLTRRELNADLEGLGLEIEPGEDAAETFQRIEGARATRDAAGDLAGQPEEP